MTGLFMCSFASQAELDDTSHVIIHTSLGDIEVELNHDKAPTTVENFIDYVDQGFYENTIFHRVIDGFMIQGGGLDANMNEKKTLASIQNEADNGLTNQKWTISMARTSDPHSASAQFFINLSDNDFLNFKNQSTNGWGYCVFGKVTKGQDIVEAIAKVKTGNKHGHQNVPSSPVVIKSIEIADLEEMD